MSVNDWECSQGDQHSKDLFPHLEHGATVEAPVKQQVPSWDAS